jgi:hypothetical protein
MAENEALAAARQTRAFLLKLIREKSTWVTGKEREFHVVADTLFQMSSEWSDRERHLRKKDE